jgi:hypothetical protein
MVNSFTLSVFNQSNIAPNESSLLLSKFYQQGGKLVDSVEVALLNKYFNALSNKFLSFLLQYCHSLLL